MKQFFYGALVLSCIITLSTNGFGQISTATANKADSKTKPADKAPNSNAQLLQVGKEKFTVGQIADAFQKNSTKGKTFYELPLDSALDFTNIYAVYRLKVQAAIEAGLDKDPEVAHDLSSNRLQLAVPPGGSGYLIERKVVDPGIEKLFKRRDEELKMAIIFTAMRPNDPADTLRAFNRTMAMLRMLKSGTDFGRLAKDSSDDGGTKINNGVIPTYITGGMIIHALEDAGYKSKSGELYPDPVKVPGGYVIVKTLDRVPRVKMRAGHILFDVTFTDTTAEGKKKAAEAYQKAQAALARIRKGESFESVAKQVSEDKVTGENGGDFLSYYTRSLGFEAKRGKLVSDFEEPMFKLKLGEISDIVKTPFGYHIIKCFDVRKPTLEEERETLRQVFRQQYLADERTKYVQSILEKQGLKINDGTLNQILGQVNQNGSTADTTWFTKISATTRSATFFTFRNTNYTVSAWVDSVKARRELSAVPLNIGGVRNSIYTLLEQDALIEEAKDLEKQYPDFARLMQEFRDGILIFKLEEKMVWNNVKYDSVAANVYFNNNRERFKTQPRLAFTEIFLYTEKDANEMFEKVKKKQTPFDTLAAQNTQRPGYRQLGGKWKLSYAKDADIVGQILSRKADAKPGDILAPFAYQGGYSIVRIDEVEAPRPMQLDEARNDLMSAYMDNLQKRLTTTWVDDLRTKYGVKINRPALLNK